MYTNIPYCSIYQPCIYTCIYYIYIYDIHCIYIYIYNINIVINIYIRLHRIYLFVTAYWIYIYYKYIYKHVYIYIYIYLYIYIYMFPTANGTSYPDLKISHQLPEVLASLGIMGDHIRTPLKPFNTTVL